MRMLKASTTRNVMVFMTSSVDHVTGATGLTLTITASKNGAAFASITPTVTERGDGWYNIALTATHTDTEGDLALHVTGTLADPSDLLCNVFVDTVVDAVWDELLIGSTHNVSTSAGRRLREISGGIVRSGTAQAGAVNSITLDSGASSTNGLYDPNLIRISGGTGAGQARLITHYTGSTKVAVVDRDWRVVPDSTSTFEIVAAPNLMSTNEGVAQSGTATTITLNTSASSIDDTYNGQTVVLRTGTGQDQTRLVTDYVGSTKVATVGTSWVTTPDSTSGYIILQTSLDVMSEVRQLLRNKRVLDPATGIETIYDDAGTALFTRQVYENAGGTQVYRGRGADRVERYT